MSNYAEAREAMVDCQIRPSDVTKYPIIGAFLETPREKFVPEDKRDVAYVGENLELGGGRFVLDPRTFAKMLDSANIKSSEAVLDIGSGMGYSAAILGQLAEFVVAVESNADMVAQSTSLLQEQNIDNTLVVSAPLNEGAAKHAPYDVIFIEGSIEELPATLEAQLRVGGRVIALFQDGALGQCRLGVKTDKGMSWRHEFDATAPLLAGFDKARDFRFG